MKVAIKYFAYGDDNKSVECTKVLDSKNGPQTWTPPEKGYIMDTIIIADETVVIIENYKVKLI